MPELPEVKTIKRQLEKEIVGKKIKSVEIKNATALLRSKKPKMPFLRTLPNKFKKRIQGARIRDITRRAKLLIIKLSNGYDLFIHLGMTGRLLYIEKTVIDFNKHNHLIYTFTDKSQLIHNDSRKIGYTEIIQRKKICTDEKYGPEPLDKNFTLGVFKRLLKNKPRQKRKFSLEKISFRPNGRKIKQFLMDQKNIAGIGNIYADEICFYAGVRPTRILSTLAKNEIKNIFIGVKKILADAIKFRGSSINNYLDSQGKAGEYHLRLKVYGRAGQPCKKCGTKVEKIKLGGRGTHFCPKCQK